MTISIKPTASGSTIEQDGSAILSIDASGNLTVPNNLSVTGTAPIPDALSTASGSAPSYSARAWVNFNGTGTVAIRASGNVSSITDNGVGDFSVNFTTAMPDANYSTCGMGRNNTGQWGVSIHMTIDPTSSVCRIRGQSDTQYGDSAFVMFAVFR